MKTLTKYLTTVGHMIKIRQCKPHILLMYISYLSAYLHIFIMVSIINKLFSIINKLFCIIIKLCYNEIVTIKNRRCMIHSIALYNASKISSMNRTQLATTPLNTRSKCWQKKCQLLFIFNQFSNINQKFGFLIFEFNIIP